MLKKRLKNVEFPCYVSIIVSDAFNLTTLRSHFYLTPFAYLMGRKKNNSDNLLWYDWSGNNSTVKGELDTKIQQHYNILDIIAIVSVDIYHESSHYGSLSDVLQEVNLYYCNNVKCTWKKWLVDDIKDIVVTLHYPDLRFTFPMPELQPSQELHTFNIDLNPRVSCKILLEDRKRYHAFFIHGILQSCFIVLLQYSSTAIYKIQIPTIGLKTTYFYSVQIQLAANTV